MKAYLLRHAESEKNVQRRHGNSSAELGLTEAGRASLATAAKSLRGAERNLRLFSSETRAAAETARALSESLAIPVNWSPELHSVNFGVISGMSDGEISRAFPDAYAQMKAYERGELHPRDFAIPGRETLTEFEDRVRSFFRNRLGTTDAFIVAHRSVITMAINTFSNYPERSELHDYIRPNVPNLSITVIHWDHSSSKICGIGLDVGAALRL